MSQAFVHLECTFEETLLLSKARGVITENILLSLKYQKQAITAELNEEGALILLPTAMRRSWIYQVLLFIVSRDISPIGSKAPDPKFS